ncbi:hypothetical protein ABZ806_09660 [Spirillospora sp. NPDC047418]
MARATTRKKRVSFYEVRDREGIPFSSPFDWDQILARLARESADVRLHRVFGADHWGKAYPFQDMDHFILARSREEGVPSYNTQTDEIIDNETDSQQPWVEISVASFVPGTNKFGFVLGSQASPRPTSMALWLNEHKFVDEELTIGPVVNQNILNRIDGAAQASLLRMKLNRDQIEAARQSGGLFSAAQIIGEEFGDVEVELQVKVSGRVTKSHDDERIQILDSVRGVVGSDVKDAVAELINFDENGKYERDEINLLEDRLAKNMMVRVTDAQGNPVRIQSAVTAIFRAIDHFGQELRH